MEKLLSLEKRQYLMGIAIVLITLHHLALYGSGFLFSLFIDGNIGVDIFFFLSVFGCCCSLKRLNGECVGFYKRRALRIYPMYVVFLFILLIFFYPDLDFCKKMSLFGAQITGLSLFNGSEILAWYVPATIVVYAVLPLIYRILVYIQLHDSASYCLQIVLLVLLLATNFKMPILMNTAFAFRLPILYLGILTFLNIHREERMVGIYVVAAVFSFFVPQLVMKASVILPLVLYGFAKSGLPLLGESVFSFLGRHSLELYLSQYIAIGTLFAHRLYGFVSENLYVQIVLSLVFTGALSVVLFYLNKLIVKYVQML